MHRSRLACTLAALAGTLVVFGTLRGALAQAANLSFSWDAPRECPDEGYVRDAIDRLLAGGPRASSHVDARAKVAKSATAWRVTLLTSRDGASGRREVEAGSCRSLADATALIVALTIDPARVAANRPEAAVQSAVEAGAPGDAGAPPDTAPLSAPDAASLLLQRDAAAPPAARPVVVDEVAPRASRGPSVDRRGGRAGLAPHGSLLALLGGDRGTLPNTAYGITLGGALLLGPLRLELYGSYWFPQDGLARAGGGGSVRLYAGGLRGCYAAIRGGFELMPCLGFEGGALHGEGFGASLADKSATGLWLALTGDARASIRLAGPLRLVLDVGFGVPFRRDSFVLSQVANPASPVTVHQAYWVEGRAFVGPEVRF